MQPCAVCGGVGIDASGYCVNCRTYRGVTAQLNQPGPEQGERQRPAGASRYPPTTYPSRSPSGSYQIYTEQPAQQPPDQRQPREPYQQSEPYQPRGAAWNAGSRTTGSHRVVPQRSTTGTHALVPRSTTGSHPVVEPGGGGPAERGSRNQLAVPVPGPEETSRTARQRRGPLLAIVGLLGVLAVAAGAVFALRDDRPTTGAAVDGCLIGAWAVTSMNMDLATEDFGTVHFTSTGEVGRVTYAADGTAVYDYGDKSQFAAEVTDAQGTRKVVLEISGTARYTVRTSNSTLHFSDVQAEGRSTLTVPGSESSSMMDIAVGTDPARYSCQGDALTTYTETYRSEAHRV